MQSPSAVSFFFFLPLQESTECAGSDKLQYLLESLLEQNAVEHVIFKHWISTDRLALKTTVKPSNEFSDVLIVKLVILQPHSFVAVKQAMYLKELKSDLHLGVVCAV
jgi:hypothetical protein